MKRWFALLAAILLLLAAYVAAGPYLAIHGIRQALAEQDTAKLEKHVDFPALRVNLRAQLEDRIARQAGADMPSNLLGAFALSVASNLLKSGVDAMVTPTGVGAMLQGRAMWKQALGETVNGDSYAAAVPADPLKQASHDYPSLSRFTATVVDEDGDPLVFVFERQGLRWRMSNIQLPP